MMGNIDHILRRYKSGSHESLIPILQDVQAEEGFISEETIVRIGQFLEMSTTKIFGLATFYDMFRFNPCGRVHLRICNGTSCFINGSASVIRALKESLGIDPGQTTRDGMFSFELRSCMGGCNDGPVISTGDSFSTRVRAEDIPVMITKLKALAEMK
jgi:NADH-quinone oxidoreductase subunit E